MKQHKVRPSQPSQPSLIPPQRTLRIFKKRLFLSIFFSSVSLTEVSYLQSLLHTSMRLTPAPLYKAVTRWDFRYLLSYWATEISWTGAPSVLRQMLDQKKLTDYAWEEKQETRFTRCLKRATDTVRCWKRQRVITPISIVGGGDKSELELHTCRE